MHPVDTRLLSGVSGLQSLRKLLKRKTDDDPPQKNPDLNEDNESIHLKKPTRAVDDYGLMVRL